MTDAEQLILALLAALHEKVDRIEAKVDPDHGLLAAIEGAVGSTVFTVSDLQRHAQVDPALSAMLGTRSPRSLGKVLARHPESFCIVGACREGRLWRACKFVNAI